MKKPTLKDIAKAAGVSIATVSYVLNKTPNQTIPAETVCRIQDIANQLGYIPNLAARSLVKQKTGLIGILINRLEHESLSRQLTYASLVNQMEQELTGQGYHVIVSSLDPAAPKLDIIAERKLDGVFLIDVKQMSFHTISSRFPSGVPLIVIDSLIDDPLFYKVNADLEGALREAAAQVGEEVARCLVMEACNNVELGRSIRRHSGLQDRDILVMQQERELELFLRSRKQHKVIVIGEFLGAVTAKYAAASDLCVIAVADCPQIVPAGAGLVSFAQNKASVACRLMFQLMEQSAELPEDKYVWVHAE
ncbi:LacI family DNA-binding transcriptional regulator [Paenibacillus hexagrammi]|uniref:LacI family transcriptional regulator n=1 Tax=Paenibacillus hexagrammi TaxID=2908839 RepID=A0ABY3SKE0_9BACL|nr:LacI family DNA-binding transcriptional regulator [Paenibacillus sp. YPD9-1]UJF33447.1 LacI family transcriptional regulator [Paenibacillus sp. YPD9-1]